MARKPETNEQFVARLMKFSRNGALMQLFILDSMERHARSIATYDPAKLAEAFEGHMIHPEAWQDTARELVAELEAR